MEDFLKEFLKHPYQKEHPDTSLWRFLENSLEKFTKDSKENFEWIPETICGEIHRRMLERSLEGFFLEKKKWLDSSEEFLLKSWKELCKNLRGYSEKKYSCRNSKGIWRYSRKQCRWNRWKNFWRNRWKKISEGIHQGCSKRIPAPWRNFRRSRCKNF